MSLDRGDRIIGSALLQGKLSWKLVTDVLLRQAKTPTEGNDAVRLLLEEGVLSPSDVIGLESTEGGTRGLEEAVRTLAPSRGESPGGDAPNTKVLTALAIPQWRQYRNLRFVGEGGMGRIYKGFDGTLRRMVALKFLRRMEPQLIARFMQEAQLQGGLEHPNICRVYEVGDWQGQAYIAMQFIKGETLDVCAASLSLREKVEVMEAAASAVHFAHRQGLIHRDLKPANIMVERQEGQSPQPFLLDFGLARGLGPSGFTVDGQIVGTYHFMAPEQARGDVQALDRRTDVYALGATLYAVLADKPPFWEVEGVEVLRRTLHDDPEPIARVVPGLAEDLETVVMKCLEKDPGQRYESARALAEDLRRFLDEEPILARRPTLRYRASKYAQKHRALVGISAAALVAVLTFGAIAAGSWATARSRARHAQAFGQEAERLEAMARYIHLLPVHDIRGERQAIRARMAHLAAQGRGGGRLAAGPAAYALGRGAMALGAVEEAHRHFQEALHQGFDGPDVRFALGRTQGALFQWAMDNAHRIGDASLRKAEEARAEREWLQPALSNLQQGAATSTEWSAFQKALLDFYARRYEAALVKAREAFSLAPWMYEAKRLEADIVRARAMAEKEHHRALPKLVEAVGLLEHARRVAPSDPSLPLSIARAWRDHLERSSFIGQEGPASLDASVRAAQEALGMDPGLAEAQVVWAQVYTAAAMGKAFRSMDVEADAKAGLEHAKAALRLDPDSLDAHQACLALLARLAWKNLEHHGPPDAYVAEMRALADRIMAKRPYDPRASILMAGLHRYRFIMLSQAGESPQSAFEAALSYLHPAAERYPDYASLHMSLGALWLEKAEHERLEGIIPRESVRLSMLAYRHALELEPDNFLAVSAVGSLQLVLGDALLSAGEDPRSALDEAESWLRKANRMHAGSENEWTELAECVLLRAEHAIEHGEDPRPLLAKTKVTLGRPGAGDTESSAVLEMRRLLVLSLSPFLAKGERQEMYLKLQRMMRRPELQKVLSLKKFQGFSAWIAFCRYRLRGDQASRRHCETELTRLAQRYSRHPHVVHLRRAMKRAPDQPGPEQGR